jgi:hypothetical protein
MSNKTLQEYKLINFNAPIHIINSFDHLVRYKGVSRTSQLLHLMEYFMRSEQLALGKDHELSTFINSVSLQERQKVTKRLIEDHEPPMLPSASDDFDWEDRFR